MADAFGRTRNVSAPRVITAIFKQLIEAVRYISVSEPAEASPKTNG